jgi:tryptophanyl-tRNA synthetase
VTAPTSSPIPGSPPRASRSQTSVAARRVLSGITPSGALTLGNYLGALRRFAEGQSAHEGFFFVADLHAMTTAHDPGRLRELTTQTAALFFASGLDLQHSTVFVQSQVPAHLELSYLLECTAHVGELGRMIQFKEKGSRPETRASLFTYPCLMAADIVLYDTESVPVGGDQDQHVELCRDLALRFNRLYGDTFVVPRLARAELASRVRDLADPAVKMSKSADHRAPGVIRMLDHPDVIARKIGRAVTDSGTKVNYDPERQPGVSNLLDIVAAITRRTPEAVAAEMSSYGELKRSCAEAVVETLTPIQRRYADLIASPDHLSALLEAGAHEARRQAGPVLARAKRAIGLLA